MTRSQRIRQAERQASKARVHVHNRRDSLQASRSTKSWTTQPAPIKASDTRKIVLDREPSQKVTKR